MSLPKTYILTFVKDNKVTKIHQSVLVQDIQRKIAECRQNPKYRGGEFQVRTLDGLLNVPILRKKQP